MTSYPLATALELQDLGIAMQSQNFRRRNPTLDEDAIQELLWEWLVNAEEPTRLEANRT